MRLVLLLLLLLSLQTVHAQELKEIFNEKAIKFVYADQYDSAVVYFSKVIALSPNDEIAYLDRGLAYERQHLLYNALADFSKQQSIDSTLPDAGFLKAILLEQLGDTATALKEYLTVTQLDFYNSDAHFYAGRCYEHMGQLVPADSCYSRALQGNPYNFQVIPFYVLCKLREKDTFGITELIDQLPADLNDPNVSFSLGAIACNSKNDSGAYSQFSRAVAQGYFSNWVLFQNDLFSCTNKSFLKTLEKEWKKSKALSHRLLVIQVALITGNRKFAEKHLESIGSEDSSIDFYRLNAVIASYKGEMENSLEWWKKVTTLQEHEGNDEYSIAMAYYHLSQPEKACEWYHRYLDQTATPLAYPLYKYCHSAN